MSRLPDLAYHFATEAQWRAGLCVDLHVDGDAVRAPGSLGARRVPGTGLGDGGALVAADPCGRVMWVRPGDRSVRRWDELGIVDLGRLVRGPAAHSAVVSGGELWLATPDGVERHDGRDLQQLGVDIGADQIAGGRPIAIAADGKGGLWVLAMRPSGCLLLGHLDCWGRALGEVVRVALAGDATGRLAATSAGSVVIVPSARSRRALVLQPGKAHEVHLLALTEGSEVRAVAVDDEDRLVVLRADHLGPGAVVEILSLYGDLEERHVIEMPKGFGTPVGVVAGRQLVVAGTGGLAVLDRSATSTARRISTFVTPTLRSPLVQRVTGGRRGHVLGGWNRAELDVTLPRGTSVEMAWAATDDQSTVERADAILAEEALAPEGQLAALDDLLPWSDDRVVYDSATDPAGVATSLRERLAAPIDRPEEHLWVRVTVTTPAGAESPTVTGLHVSYPSSSYVDDLPAVYREDPMAAPVLRRLLAPFEVLFDELDAKIDALPSRIDPDTADDEWTSVLLGWLGMPALDDLASDRRHALLSELPRLHQARGTEGALVRALEIVTGHPVRIRDRGSEPGWWFLPRSGRSGGAQLGIDTVVVAALPAPFRAGTAVVGSTPLGVGCLDSALILGQHAGLVEVRVELPAEERASVRPIVDRILDVFAPAHCRIVVDDRPGSGAARSRSLGVDLRLAETGTAGADSCLHHDEHWQLGATTQLGSWPLPSPSDRLAVLDDPAHGGAPTYLI